MPSRFIYVVPNKKIPPLDSWIIFQYVYIHTHTHMYIHITFLFIIHWWTLRLSPYVDIVSDAAANMGLQICLQDDSISLGCILKNGITLSFIFNFLRSHHTVFHVTFPPTVCKYSLFSSSSSVFAISCHLIRAILIDLRWDIIVILICISLVNRNAEQFTHTCCSFVYHLWKNV